MSSSKTKFLVDEWGNVSSQVDLTKKEMAFILSAIDNYCGYGDPRSDVIRKLSKLFSEEELKYIRAVWGRAPRPVLSFGD